VRGYGVGAFFTVLGGLALFDFDVEGGVADGPDGPSGEDDEPSPEGEGVELPVSESVPPDSPTDGGEASVPPEGTLLAPPVRLSVL
jgi:hypothetical protein